LLLAVIFTFLGLFILQSGSTHAASMTVNTDTHPSACTLDEAIDNINNQTQMHTDCAAGDGSNDTINIPAGRVLLTADLPDIALPVTVTGAGIGNTTIDGNGQYRPFYVDATTAVFTDLTFESFTDGAILSGDSNVTAERLDVDGTNAAPGTNGFQGLWFTNGFSGPSAGATTVALTDVYVHDFSDPDGGQGIFTSAGNGATLNLSFDRVTVEGIDGQTRSSLGVLFLLGFATSNTPGTINANVRNTTISGITSTGADAIGIGTSGYVDGGDSSITLNANNITINDINGPTLGSFGTKGTVGIGGIGGAAAPSDSFTITTNLTNALLVRTEDGANCVSADISGGFNGTGSLTLAGNSSGGNLANDDTCSSYFNHSTDQNNVANLASLLGPIAFNGGYIPTIPLLQGSPAIDNGVTVAGLSTDARQVARPQGTAFDSGAYEYAPPVATNLADTGQSISLYAILAVITTGLSGFIIYKKA